MKTLISEEEDASGSEFTSAVLPGEDGDGGEERNARLSSSGRGEDDDDDDKASADAKWQMKIAAAAARRGRFMPMQ